MGCDFGTLKGHVFCNFADDSILELLFVDAEVGHLGGEEEDSDGRI